MSEALPKGELSQCLSPKASYHKASPFGRGVSFADGEGKKIQGGSICQIVIDHEKEAGLQTQTCLKFYLYKTKF